MADLGFSFDDFFQSAVRFQPMEWQRRLAGARDADAAVSAISPKGSPCKSRLVDIPTGLGKTAGAVFAWLWNRIVLQADPWPRRLIYCLPMRTLVEQTQSNVRIWLLRLALASTQDDTPERTKVNQLIDQLSEKKSKEVRAPSPTASGATPVAGFLAGDLSNVAAMFVWLAEHSPIVLMGGEELDEPRQRWDVYPEKPAILIGTQDMLLSRALNRGYGMSRYRWPVHFALLNTDCLWVMDEVQLMGSGLTTSLQLQAWRERPPSKQAKGLLPSHSWWMSATAAEHWFKKSIAIRNEVEVLWQNREKLDPGKDDTSLLKTPKTLERCTIIATPDQGGGDSKWSSYAQALAGHLADIQNRIGRKKVVDASETDDLLVLVICNTVERAVAVYREMKALPKRGSEERLFDDYHLLLLHSRFRGYERASWQDRLDSFEKGTDKQSGARIVVATQVIEAGVDLSASLLYTELCPLPSLIQRLGRCARRRGDVGRAFWIDFEAFEINEKEFSEEQIEIARPYDPDTIAAARRAVMAAEQRVAQIVSSTSSASVGTPDG